MRRRYLRAIASSLAVTLLAIGFAATNARAFLALLDGWFGPLPEAIAETPAPEPEPVARSRPTTPVRPPAPRKENPKPQPILADPKPTERLAFRPHEVDGKVTGIEFSGVPSGSLFDLLGLRKGDVLQSINGYSMNNPEEALRAYAMLRRAPLVRVVVLREGRPVEIVIHIL